MDKRVPEVRFKGFTDDWEQRTLDEVASIIMGQSPSSSNYTNNPNDHILVQGNADIKNGKVLPRVWTTQVTKAAKKGSFILSVRAPVGDVAKTDFAVVLGRGVAGISGTDFIYHILVRMKLFNYWRKLSTGSTFESINSEDIKNANSLLPSKNEQKKISVFLNTVDNLITLQQSQLLIYKRLRKNLLQRIFPLNGRKVPRIRLANFNGNWELCKLGDLGSVAMNKRIFKNQTSSIGDVPFFKIGTFGGNADAYISKELFKEYKSKYPYPKVGDILISASGSIGRFIVYDGKDEYFQDSNIVWLKHDDRLDNKFLLQFYSIVKWKGLEGSTIKRLYNKNILNTYISIPSINEQRSLGHFLEKIDKLIDLQQQTLLQLEKLKQYYLQKLFI
ncbi:restriction endonuclease subunit S [Companilactobacillus nodensis]|uniref:Type I restriction-modification system specificity subunit n=1 Tax=Companilactobacillus nodensis DSM 19682 = JCM 14932 = NBRC 107160 TaxID=1423775 RepID=A0A0R1KB54_9LACO|nr:restriction endonuclease subunit S [Companilactobacillus nodensis]KRK80893.1 type I restriction-modification system specificity subunit [Companilactobacillus nodensis DSM 19682 = JCM 14932 = NBRC 107160]